MNELRAFTIATWSFSRHQKYLPVTRNKLRMLRKFLIVIFIRLQNKDGDYRRMTARTRQKSTFYSSD